MPNCFSLTPKSESEPTNLVDVDNMMRTNFNAPSDADHWFKGWYDIIGFSLAMGRSFDELRKRYIEFRDTARYCDDDWLHAQWLIDIVDYLDMHYTSDCWAEIGRR